jgi:hypothetical protein
MSNDWTARIRMSATHNDVTVRSAQGEEISFDRNGMKPGMDKQLIDGVILGFFGKKGLGKVKQERYRAWKERKAHA